MLRLILAIIVTAAAVGFSLANTHRVSLSFIFGAPVHVRMIFLLLSAYTAGALTMFFAVQITAVKKSLRERREERERQMERERELGSDDLVST